MATSFIRSMWQRLWPLPQVSEREFFLSRSFFAFALAMFFPWVMTETSQPVPVGLAHFLDLTWISQGGAMHYLRAGFFGLLFCYAAGLALPIVLPLLLVVQILPYTLFNSQGSPHHGYQILSLALLGITCASVIHGHSHWKGRRTLALLALALGSGYLWQLWMVSGWRSALVVAVVKITGSSLSGWAMLILEGSAFSLISYSFSRVHAASSSAAHRTWHLMAAQWMAAATYFISVCSKMIESQGGWFARSHYIVLDMVKATRQSYYSHLDPALRVDPPAMHFFMEHQNLTRLFFSSGVILELLLILAVGTRQLALAFGIAAILMHRSIEALMTLSFHTNEAVLAIFFVNLPYWLSWLREQSKPVA
jgi:hypothetical protein